MVDNHTHDADGNVIVADAPTEVEIIEAPETVSNDVEIAKINADKEIQLAKIAARQVEPDLEVALAAALAEIEALKLAMTPPEPAVEESPAPIVLEAPEPSESQEEASLPEPEIGQEHQDHKKHKPVGLGVW